jgi:hypothetical protein
MSKLPHPLVRMGTSQDERMTEALAPESVRLDDRSFAQLLIWMRGYARQLVYYASSGNPAGSWLPLMRDECMLVAQIQYFELARVERRQSELEQKAAAAKGQPAALQPVIVATIHDIATLLETVRGWRALAVEGRATWRALDLSYRGELARIAAVLRHVVVAWNTRADGPQRISISFDDEIVDAVETVVWQLAETGDEFWQLAAEVLLDLQRRVSGELRRLVRHAPALLADALDYPGHRPDQGLLLAFLQLYGNHAQAVLNGIPRRHLDFYFQRALGLGARPAVPDRAYVVLGLAKHVDQHRLAAGTRFWAKDPSGAKLQFALEQEFVPNRAHVAQLAGLYVRRSANDAGEASVELFASPHVDSLDGMGQPFAEGQPNSWHPFGWADTPRTSRAVRAGLAIATPTLWMAEGPRRIQLQLRVQLPRPAILDALVQASERARLRDELEQARGAAQQAIGVLQRVGLFHSTGSRSDRTDDLIAHVTARVSGEQSLRAAIDKLGPVLRGSPSADAVRAAKKLAGVSLSGAESGADRLLEQMVRALHELPRIGWVDQELLAFQRQAELLGEPEPDAARPMAGSSPSLLTNAKRTVEKIETRVPAAPDIGKVKSLRELVEGDPEAVIHELSAALEAAKQAFTIAERRVPIEPGESRDQALPWRDLIERSSGWLDDLRWLQSLELMSRTRRDELQQQSRFASARERLALLPDFAQLLGLGLQQVLERLEQQRVRVRLPQLSWALTGAKGWLHGNAELRAAIVPSDTGVQHQLELTISIANELPAIVGYDAKLHLGSYETSAPMLTLQFGPDEHGLLNDARLDHVTMRVSCDEVRNLVLHTPNGPAKPDKPVICFGPAPRRGAALLIGSWEVFSKRLERVALTLDWVDELNTIFRPRPLRDLVGQSLFGEHEAKHEAKPDPQPDQKDRPPVVYQAPYTEVSVAEFRACPSLLHGGAFHQIGDVPSVCIADELAFDNLSEHAATPTLPRFDRYAIGQAAGFMRLTLDTPLQHADYPRLIAQKVSAGHADEIPAPPWTPVLASLKLAYSAVVDANPAAPPSDLELFHLLPFGHRRLQPSGALSLLPRLEAHETKAGLPAALVVGALYIAVADLKPRQSLSLLVQVAQGSANPDSQRPQIYWSYLDGDEWHDLPPARLLADGSIGLLGSGIVRVDLPELAGTRHHTMPTDLRWLRAAVTEHPDGVSRLVDIHAQATCVVFVDDGRSSARLASPLPADSIKKLVESDAAIKTIDQPFSSWGGMVAEQVSSTPSPDSRDPRYDRRVHERLRHKGRAITVWDYERLVLEHFPEVFRVKCLPHTGSYGPRTPGSITLVVVAKLDNVNAPDPLRPEVSHETRARIREFLLARACPHLRSGPGETEWLRVCNPTFTPVQVTTTVELEAGLDAGYWGAQLQRDLDRFLAPWVYEPVTRRGELRFGGRVPASAFVDFMHELDYVRTVRALQLIVDGKLAPDGAVADGLDAILVPSQPHDITIHGEGDT